MRPAHSFQWTNEDTGVTKIFIFDFTDINYLIKIDTSNIGFIIICIYVFPSKKTIERRKQNTTNNP